MAQSRRGQLSPSIAQTLRSLPVADRRLDDIKRAPWSPNPVVRMGDQAFKQVNRGGACVLVPVDNSGLSPAELSQRQRDVARIVYMTDHPLGSAAYGLATLAKAPRKVRDQALLAGGAVDTGLALVAPRVRQALTPPTAPRLVLDSSIAAQPNIRFGQLTNRGQATGVRATITAPMLRTGTRANPKVRPPGWQGHGKTYNEGRGHLLGKQLGGTGADVKNLMTLTQNNTNSSWMQSFENGVARMVRAGQVVEYSVLPLYSGRALPPQWVLMTAVGSRDSLPPKLVPNPAGRRK